MKTWLRTTLGAGLLALGLTASAHAGIRVHISLPIEIVATDTPVYFEGHAAYWYGDRWYYRVGHDWYGYESEPVYLRDYRLHHAHERRFYGRDHDHWEHRQEWHEEHHHDEHRQEHHEERHDRRDHH